MHAATVPLDRTPFLTLYAPIAAESSTSGLESVASAGAAQYRAASQFFIRFEAGAAWCDVSLSTGTPRKRDDDAKSEYSHSAEGV